MSQLPSYGGQAVLEGVMMRGTRAMAVAVRAPNQAIVMHIEPLSNLYRGRLSRMPFVRGLLGLWDALGLGFRSLSFSANIAGGEEAKFEGAVAWGTIAVSLTFSIGLFFVAPALVAQAGESWLGLSVLSTNRSENLSTNHGENAWDRDTGYE